MYCFARLSACLLSSTFSPGLPIRRLPVSKMASAASLRRRLVPWSPGSGAAEAPGAEAVASTMSRLCTPRVPRGPGPLALLLLLLLGPSSVLPISFHLPVNSRKCLREEIHKDLLVTGEYEITDQSGGAGGLRTHLKITDSAGHILYSKEDATKGKFAFTTEDYDMFEACFESKGTGRTPDQLVILDMKHGVEAKNYEEIAKVEKLKPLEVELRRLEDLSESIVNDFAYMKKREEEMRDTNESTNTRVLYFSIFSMFCLIGLATWQVFYLRRFFKAKKLIE